jgi:hypothetical protein
MTWNGINDELTASFGDNLPVGTYTVGIRARDNAGNWGTAITSELVVKEEEPQTFTLAPTANNFIRAGGPHRNEGANTYMQLQASGDNRSLVKFDQSAIAATVGSGTVTSARLELTILGDSGTGWSTSGRTIDLHRMLADWLEGNGTENDRGTGSGVTWACAVDSDISDASKDCSGTTEWDMQNNANPAVHPWFATPTATQTIVNNQSGVVNFDVTGDVIAFMAGTANDGWLVKKTNGQPGQVSFGTKEGGSSVQAKLIITYQP